MSKTIRVSVVQAGAVSHSLKETLDKVERFARVAKERDGAELVVFPEAFIGGYPKYSDFGAVVGARSDSGRAEFARYFNGAIELPSPALSRVEAVAAELGVFIIVGVIERAGGTLYCTALFVDPKKGLAAKHRKLVPTAAERVIWGQGDASTLPVLEVEFSATSAKLSTAICWENYMPLLRTFYYEQGVQIYCAPTVDARPVWQNTMTHIALEGRCFVLSACQFTTQADYHVDQALPPGEQRDPAGVMIAGGSVIVDPLGTVLAGPLWNEEGVLSATLDLDKIAGGHLDLDVVGHYARPDIFKLQVNAQI